MTRIDFVQAPAGFPKLVDQRARLPFIGIQPLPYHGFLVILTNDQAFAIAIAHTLHPRRFRCVVIQGAALRALPTTSETRDNYIVINNEMNYHWLRADAFQ